MSTESTWWKSWRVVLINAKTVNSRSRLVPIRDRKSRLLIIALATIGVILLSQISPNAYAVDLVTKPSYQYSIYRSGGGINGTGWAETIPWGGPGGQGTLSPYMMYSSAYQYVINNSPWSSSFSTYDSSGTAHLSCSPSGIWSFTPTTDGPMPFGSTWNCTADFTQSDGSVIHYDPYLCESFYDNPHSCGGNYQSLSTNPHCTPPATYRQTYNGISGDFCVESFPNEPLKCGIGAPPTVGDPVNLLTGEESYDVADYRTGSGLSISRSYSSRWMGLLFDYERPLLSSIRTVTLPAVPRYLRGASRDSGGLYRSVQALSYSLAPGESYEDLVYYDRRSVPTYYAAGNGWISNGSGGNPARGKVLATLANGTRRYAVMDPMSNVLLTFDESGRLIAKASANGLESVFFTYHRSGVASFPLDAPQCVSPAATSTNDYVLKCQTDRYGRQIRYTSNSSGDVTSALLPDGSTIGYSYDASTGMMTSATFQDGHRIFYIFGESGLATAGSGQTSNEDPYAARPERQLTGIGRNYTTGETVREGTITYDSSGRVASTLEVGASSAYQFSFSGMQTRTVSPNGSAQTYQFSSGLVSSASQPAGAGCAPAVSTATYVNYWMPTPLSTVDFAGSKSCYSYDNSRVLQLAKIAGYTSAQSCPADVLTSAPAVGTVQTKETALWHPVWNLKSREAAPKLITTWVYNGQPDPTNSNSITTCAPTTALVGDQPVAVLCKRVEQATSDDNGALGFSATSVGTARTWTWTYNQWGQKLTENGPRTDVTDTSSWTYYSDTTADHLPGDLQQATNALGQVTQYPKYDRNGRVLKMIAADGAITEYLYHVRGWPTQVKVTPAGGGTAQITNITYEPTGKVKRVTQPDASWVENTYDAAQRLISQKDNLNNVVAYTLDNSGNRIKEEYRDSSASLKRNIERSYDALNRLQASAGQ